MIVSSMFHSISNSYSIGIVKSEKFYQLIFIRKMRDCKGMKRTYKINTLINKVIYENLT